MKSVDLFAVQPRMTLADYADTGAYSRKLSALMDRVDALRDPELPALVAFPEEIGTFLALIGEPRLERARTVDGAMLRVALRNWPQLVRAMIAQKIWRPSLALLHARGTVALEVYRMIFSSLASSYHATIVAGSLLAPDGGRDVFNLSLTFGPDGRELSRTRKVNLVPTLEDALRLSPGDAKELRAVDTPAGRVGTLICYDGFAVPHSREEPNFCVAARILDEDGAEILVQPSANPWPWDGSWRWRPDMLRRDQWLSEGLFAQLPSLRRARYVLTPMLIANIFDHSFDGRSYIFRRDPDGSAHIVAQAARSDDEEILHHRASW